MIDCLVSVVLYKNPPEMVLPLLKGLCESEPGVAVCVVDNSPTPDLRPLCASLPVRYHHYGANVGYGKGHNWAIFNAGESRYHLVLNPDVVLEPGTIGKLVRYMDRHADAGILCTTVLNEDGTVQYLNKRHPALVDLFVRRFVPKRMHHLFEGRLARYEMRDVGYHRECSVEFLSGCFMLCRSDVLRAVGGFDDRYFMYFEDCDLCRKVQLHGYRTVYYPGVSIVHRWERAAHKDPKMTWVFMVSMGRYFNKWGWKLW